MDYTAPYDEDMLIAETATGPFAFRNKIKPQEIRLLWDKLSLFLAETLKGQKGVLLPNLGNFKVGPVLGESRKKIRPGFALLEGRYGGVSQERAKYIIGGRAPIVQPNYGMLAINASIHRGICQRLVAEMLQRLGVHILSGRPIKVKFRDLGKLVTNRTGRVEFVFEPLFLEYFEQEHYAAIKEMAEYPEDYELHKKLQEARLDGSPAAYSKSRPVSAHSSASKQPTGHSPHTPFKGILNGLFRMCKGADRTGSGCVLRLELEQWLHTECRALLCQVDAATLLDLLDAHTYGKTSKQILYQPFLHDLDAAIGPYFNPVVVSPERLPHKPAPYQEQEGLSPQPAALAAPAVVPVAPAAPAAPAALSQQQPVQTPLPVQQQHAAAAMQGQQAAGVNVTSPTETTYDPEAYLHYYQNQLSPRSRAEFDGFNRMHFDHLRRTRDKRAVTPKVGEEPLNLAEYQAVRSSQSPRANTPGRPLPHDFFSRAAAPPPVEHNMLLPCHNQHVRASPVYSSPQILRLSHDAALHAASPGTSGAAGSPAAVAGPASASPLPAAAPRMSLPITEYDIANAPNPMIKRKLRSEMAHMLQDTWEHQIKEKDAVEDTLAVAEQRWPFTTTHAPADKRPISAISRPYSPRRHSRSASPS